MSVSSRARRKVVAGLGRALDARLAEQRLERIRTALKRLETEQAKQLKEVGSPQLPHPDAEGGYWQVIR